MVRVLLAVFAVVTGLLAGTLPARAGLTDRLNGSLVAIDRTIRFPDADVRTLLNAIIPGVSQQPTLDMLRIRYRTRDTGGQLITVSGTIVLPRHLSGARPMISIQHGTTYIKQPSATYRMVSDSGIGGVGYLDPLGFVLAGLGYVVLVPDYIGYGITSNLMHPYLIADSLGGTVADMIRASRAVLARQNVRTDGKVFLAGYSEGGYATMAAQKVIEARYPDIRLTAVAPMAGPYDLATTARRLIRSGVAYSRPEYLPFVIKAYLETYNLGGLDTVFRSAYVGPIRRFFAKNSSDEEGSSLFPQQIDRLFRADALAAYQGNGQTELKRRIQENTLLGWTPRAPMALFHCEGDDQVPVANATAAQQAFRRRGVAVELHTYPGGSHIDCVQAELGAVEFFIRHGGLTLP